MTLPPRRPAGFTLVELAVVLIILALVLGSLYLPLSAQQDNRQYGETEKQLNEIRDALMGYAQINGRLPCPASSATGNGKEDCAAGNNGFVPWAELGVQPADVWGRMIRYRVSTAFRTPPTFTAATAGELKIATRQGVTLVDQTNEAPRDVIFALVSYGKNGYQSTLRDGSAGPPKPAGLLSPDEDSNADTASTVFVARPPSPEGAATIGAFDDVVVWMPRTLFMTRLASVGKLTP